MSLILETDQIVMASTTHHAPCKTWSGNQPRPPGRLRRLLGWPHGVKLVGHVFKVEVLADDGDNKHIGVRGAKKRSTMETTSTLEFGMLRREAHWAIVIVRYITMIVMARMTHNGNTWPGRQPRPHGRRHRLHRHTQTH